MTDPSWGQSPQHQNPQNQYPQGQQPQGQYPQSQYPQNQPPQNQWSPESSTGQAHPNAGVNQGWGQPSASQPSASQPSASQPSASQPQGWGQQPASSGHLGQPAAAGQFGQPASSGQFGQPAAAGQFGQPAAGQFGQQPAAQKPVFEVPGSPSQDGLGAILRWGALAASVVMFFSAFMPWVKIDQMNVSASGTDGDGWFVLLAGLVAAAFVFLNVGSKPGVVRNAVFVAMGAIAALVSLVAFGNIGDVSEDFLGTTLTASPGAGLIFGFIASLALIGIGVVGLVKKA